MWHTERVINLWIISYAHYSLRIMNQIPTMYVKFISKRSAFNSNECKRITHTLTHNGQWTVVSNWYKCLMQKFLAIHYMWEKSEKIIVIQNFIDWCLPFQALVQMWLFCFDNYGENTQNFGHVLFHFYASKHAHQTMRSNEIKLEMSIKNSHQWCWWWWCRRKKYVWNVEFLI